MKKHKIIMYLNDTNIYLYNTRIKKSNIVNSYLKENKIIKRSIKNGYISNPIILESILENNIKKWSLSNLFVNEIVVYLDVINVSNRLLISQILNTLGYKNIKHKSVINKLKSINNKPVILLQSTFMIIYDNNKRIILYESFYKNNIFKSIKLLINNYIKLSSGRYLLAGEYKEIKELAKSNDSLLFVNSFKDFIFNTIKDN